MNDSRVSKTSFCIKWTFKIAQGMWSGPEHSSLQFSAHRGLMAVALNHYLSQHIVTSVTRGFP